VLSFFPSPALVLLHPLLANNLNMRTVSLFTVLAIAASVLAGPLAAPGQNGIREVVKRAAEPEPLPQTIGCGLFCI